MCFHSLKLKDRVEKCFVENDVFNIIKSKKNLPKILEDFKYFISVEL